MAQIPLKVNGQTHTVEAEPDMPLLYALRDDLRLNGPKFGSAPVSMAKAKSLPGITPIVDFL
jgi:aerobic-type carbon monoxide dehydrogenase small subunit (CoxS/CutS family)